jgi:hypothetical protein
MRLDGADEAAILVAGCDKTVQADGAHEIGEGQRIERRCQGVQCHPGSP